MNEETKQERDLKFIKSIGWTAVAFGIFKIAVILATLSLISKNSGVFSWLQDYPFFSSYSNLFLHLAYNFLIAVLLIYFGYRVHAMVNRDTYRHLVIIAVITGGTFLIGIPSGKPNIITLLIFVFTFSGLFILRKLKKQEAKKQGTLNNEIESSDRGMKESSAYPKNNVSKFINRFTKVKVKRGFVLLLAFATIVVLLWLSTHSFSTDFSKQIQKDFSSKYQTDEQTQNSDSLPQNFINQVAKATVAVRCQIVQKNVSGGISQGTGIALFPLIGSGYLTPILTAAHVIGGPDVLAVRFKTENGKRVSSFPCAVAFPDPNNFEVKKWYAGAGDWDEVVSTQADVAILEVSQIELDDFHFPINYRVDVDEKFPYMGVDFCKPSTKVVIGDKVTLFGYPFFGGNSLTVTDGIISGFGELTDGLIYKTSAKIDSGASGGPAILNKEKCILGILTWGIKGDFEGIGYIQSWEWVKKYLPK